MSIQRMEVITNMKKKILLLSLVASFVLGGCTSSYHMSRLNNEEPVGVIPPYEPPTPPEQPKNIYSINILGIPSDYKVAMGLFDEANIRCEITYVDNTTSTFQLLEENLPYEVREMLGVEGEHVVAVQIAGKIVSFKIIMVDEGIRYHVTFRNYNDDILYQTKVMPLNKAHYEGDEPHRMSDIVYKFKHNGWTKEVKDEQGTHYEDIDLDTYLVDSDITVRAKYDTVFRNNDYLPIEQGTQFVADYTGVIPNTSNEGHYVANYIGRFYHFPIARYIGQEFTNHTQGNKEYIDCSFGEDDYPDGDYDTTTTVGKYHPKIELTLPGIITKSYNYVAPGEEINKDYIPVFPEFINFASINDIPFELKPIRSRNNEGKTYTTVVNDYAEVISDYLSTPRNPRLYIPEDFPDGKYTASLFIDIDVYAYVYVENRPTGLSNSGMFAVSCVSDIYLGIDSYENRIESVTNFKTSTYEEDMMTVDMFIPMMKDARSAYEE